MAHTPIGDCTSDCRRVGCPEPEEVDGYTEYLESLKKFATAIQNFAESSKELREMVEETGNNTQNLVKEINKRIGQPHQDMVLNALEKINKHE